MAWIRQQYQHRHYPYSPSSCHVLLRHPEVNMFMRSQVCFSLISISPSIESMLKSAYIRSWYMRRYRYATLFHLIRKTKLFLINENMTARWLLRISPHAHFVLHHVVVHCSSRQALQKMCCPEEYGSCQLQIHHLFSMASFVSVDPSVSVSAWVFVCVHIYVYISMCTYLYIYIFTCTYTQCIHTHTHTHAYIHTHITNTHMYTRM